MYLKRNGIKIRKFHVILLLGMVSDKTSFSLGFPGGAVVKNPAAKAGDARDTGSIPGSGRSPGVGNGNLL